MSEEMILMKKEGTAAIISLNREQKKNALSVEMMWRLADELDAASEDKETRVVIIKGEGSCFSAGVDFNSLAGLSQKHKTTAEFRNFLTKFQAVFNRMEQIEKPVIVAAHSYCLGMALELALAADFRIVAEGTQLGLPETELGLIPDVGGTSRLTTLVGPGYAKELIMTAKRIDARRAYEIGLVNEVVAPEQLMNAAMRWADELGGCAPLAVGFAKKIINRGAHLDGMTFRELEAYAQSTLLGTSDVQEGVMAKMQKRKPVFKGK